MYRELLGFRGAQMSAPTTPKVILHWALRRKRGDPHNTYALMAIPHQTHVMLLSPSAESAHAHCCGTEGGLKSVQEAGAVFTAAVWVRFSKCVCLCADLNQYWSTNKQALSGLQQIRKKYLSKWINKSLKRLRWGRHSHTGTQLNKFNTLLFQLSTVFYFIRFDFP